MAREPTLGIKGTARLDRITEAALELIEAHQKSRNAKTARLRELRLKKDAEDLGRTSMKPRR